MRDETKIFGFWIYLMTDLVVFGVLIATYVILRNSTFGGPSAKELFQIPFIFAETLILLTSSFTCSLATYSVYREKKNEVIFWFLMTFLLGSAFLFLEFSEFSKLITEGNSYQRSAFLSSFFALVATHGFHIFIGLLWILILSSTIFFRGLMPSDISRVFRAAYFWHFLDVVWIFIFTVVYGMGHLSYA